MSRLTIEYVLNGHRRGYNFTSPTHLYAEETLRFIWRTAMPRGQGWGSDQYIGARSLKCFRLPDERIAMAEVTVTDMTDESGRRGIRRALIDVMTPLVFGHHLRSRLSGYPAPVLVAAKSQFNELSRRMPKVKQDQSVIISQPFTTPQAWWPVEATILMVCAQPPARLQKHPQPISFTTLALDHRAESVVVAMPEEKAETVTDMPVMSW
jgi:hypothetical protein